MSKHLHLLAAVVIGFVANDALAQATSVTLQLFPFTGEVRLLNENIDPFSFAFYSLKSPSGALNGANGVWTSIADTYDVSGNGFIDATNEWIELSANATELTEITEGAFSGPGGTLAAQRSVSLGRIWDPNAVSTSDVSAQVFRPNGLPRDGHRSYRGRRGLLKGPCRR